MTGIFFRRLSAIAGALHLAVAPLGAADADEVQQQFWRDAEFVAGFIGSYGVNEEDVEAGVQQILDQALAWRHALELGGGVERALAAEVLAMRDIDHLFRDDAGFAEALRLDSLSLRRIPDADGVINAARGQPGSPRSIASTSTSPSRTGPHSTSMSPSMRR